MGKDAFVALRRIALLAWFLPSTQVYIDAGLRDSCLAMALDLWANLQPESGFTEKDRDEFIQDDLLAVYGPDMFFSRLYEVLRRPGLTYADAYIVLPTGLRLIIKNPAFHSRFVSSDVLGAVRGLVDIVDTRQTSANAEWELHEAILLFFS